MMIEEGEDIHRIVEEIMVEVVVVVVTGGITVQDMNVTIIIDVLVMIVTRPMRLLIVTIVMIVLLSQWTDMNEIVIMKVHRSQWDHLLPQFPAHHHPHMIDMIVMSLGVGLLPGMPVNLQCPLMADRLHRLLLPHHLPLPMMKDSVLPLRLLDLQTVTVESLILSSLSSNF